jgi:uncharacterized lipoprotein YbaY
MIVTGVIECTDVVEPVSDATLHIRLQDVSGADASAEVLADQVIRGISLSPPGESVAFAFEVPALEPRGIYAIEAHLDVTGSGEVAVGDFLTMEHFGVDPTLESQSVMVRVKQIR